MSEQSLPVSAGSLGGAEAINQQAQSLPIPAVVPERARPKGGFDIMTLLTYIYLVVMLLFALFPLYFVLQASLNSTQSLFTTDLHLFPPRITLDNYIYDLTQLPLLQWIWNSTVVGLVTMLIGLIFAIFGGYALSRFRFRGRITGLMGLLALQAFPGLLALPAYFSLLNLVDDRINFLLGLSRGAQHVYGSLPGLILVYAAGPLAFGVWNMKGYFDTLPIELEQAAMVDGTTLTGAFLRVTLPLAAPALVTTGMFMFIGVWNEFAVAHWLLDPTNQSQLTFPLGLQSLSGTYRTPWGQFAAASVMASIPLMGLFLYAQNYFKSGLTIGGVKG